MVGTPFQRGEEHISRERMEAPLSSALPIPSQEALTYERGGEEAVGRGRQVGGGSKVAGGCGKIPIVVANLTVSLDGCRGQVICFRQGGASQEEALTYRGRQSPPRRNSSRLER